MCTILSHINESTGQPEWCYYRYHMKEKIWVHAALDLRSSMIYMADRVNVKYTHSTFIVQCGLKVCEEDVILVKVHVHVKCTPTCIGAYRCNCT